MYVRDNNPPLSPLLSLYMSRLANYALLEGGVRFRVWIREQRKIKKKIKLAIRASLNNYSPSNWIGMGFGRQPFKNSLLLVSCNQCCECLQDDFLKCHQKLHSLYPTI